MLKKNPVYEIAKALAKNLDREISKLKEVDQLHDFERRTRSLIAMSKAVQTFSKFVSELESKSKDEDGTIDSVMEFREELAQRIRALVSEEQKDSKGVYSSTEKV